MKKATKEIYSIETSDTLATEENKEFNELINNWTTTSQRILLMMNQKENVINKNKNPKYLMALGAMGAHINMALQALKTIESDQ